MRTYSVGDETKESILNVCRKLFYEKGFENTSYDDICRDAGVNRGLIPYHFKSKSNIAGIIFEEIITRLDEEAEKVLNIEDQNVFYVITELLLFREARSNKNFCRFYSEVENSNDCYAVTLKSQIELIESILRYNHMELEEPVLRTIGCMYEGTERELIQNIYREYLTEPIDKIVYRDIYFVYSSLGFHRKDIDALFEKALSAANQYKMVIKEGFVLTIQEK